MSNQILIICPTRSPARILRESAKEHKINFISKKLIGDNFPLYEASNHLLLEGCFGEAAIKYCLNYIISRENDINQIVLFGSCLAINDKTNNFNIGEIINPSYSTNGIDRFKIKSLTDNKQQTLTCLTSNKVVDINSKEIKAQERDFNLIEMELFHIAKEIQKTKINLSAILSVSDIIDLEKSKPVHTSQFSSKKFKSSLREIADSILLVF